MLVKENIKAQVDALLTVTASLEQEKSKDEFASKLADVIIAAIQSARITIPSGAIQTAGSATAQSNVNPVIVEGGLT